jgi:hypothetical protein
MRAELRSRDEVRRRARAHRVAARLLTAALGVWLALPAAAQIDSGQLRNRYDRSKKSGNIRSKS